mmetsp:Transcript_23545/g.36313  ORF Transcript_23545/g.36313 Transcript_23545/m.36313 type:complete len:604 (+) Transcript_23545:125-1936(+)
MDIPTWCQVAQIDAEEHFLSQSAIKFLSRLNLPEIHPFCRHIEGIEGQMHFSNVDDTFHFRPSWEGIVTFFSHIAPPLLAMSELWLRLFAGILAPLVSVYLIRLLLLCGSNLERNTKFQSAIILVGVASSAVLLTDALYVQEYGREPGASLLILILGTLFLLKKNGNSHGLGMTMITSVGIFVIMGLTLLALLNDAVQGEASIDIPDIKPGLYYNQQNPSAANIVDTWIKKTTIDGVSSLNYDEGGSTKWLMTGDTRTGIPFLINADTVPDPRFIRRWVPIEDDTEKEAVALDIAFPPGGAHNDDRPMYLVLHGLNGGSGEEYIKEFVNRETAKGSTVCVMIARGLMDTPVIGENVFHGARIKDVEAAAKALRRVTKRSQTLAGAGYSMGAIILANYVARSGTKCFLDAAVVVSGGLDMREQANFHRSIRLWQPMLAQEARNIMFKKFRHLYKDRLTAEQYLSLMRAKNIQSIDIHGIATYNRFDGIMDYYSKMSAMGDTDLQLRDDDSSALTLNGRISNVHIPLCVVHALDDPLITWRTLNKPEKVVYSGNIFMLITQTGGHVGWPLQMNPKTEGWRWMNEYAVSSFVNSVDAHRNNRGAQQ